MNTFFLTDFSWIFSFLFFLYLVATLIFIVMENRDANSTFSWILVFIFFPILGFLVYLFFGRNWRAKTKKRKRFKRIIDRKLLPTIKPFKQNSKNITSKLSKEIYSEYPRLIKTINTFQESLPTQNNKVEILKNGSKKFPALEKDLKKAKKYIHMEYFIWRNDKLTQRIKNILIEKAKQGVKIKILYDPAGSISFVLKGRLYRKELRKAGVKIIPFFNSMARSGFTTLNNINHQKIVIIDGHTAYTGGMNMGQEYIDGKPKFNFWRDTQIKLQGESVLALHSTFMYHWISITKESLFIKKYLENPQPVKNDLAVTTISSGPESSDSYVRQLFATMINSAQKKIYIQSPYFIPDPTIFEALKIAAMTGIDTRIMITGNPDHKIAWWAAFSYFEDLLKSGVKIYHYNKGFLHAKTISLDSKICTIGSTNIDSRSFTTSYELNAVIFDKKISKKVEQDFREDLRHCKELTLKHCEAMNPLFKLRNSFLRILSPIM